MVRMVLILVMLHALTPSGRPAMAADATFITIDTMAEAPGIQTVKPGFGRMALKFSDGAGNEVTPAVRAQGYFHWRLKRRGANVDSTVPLEAGTYEFFLDYGGRFERRDIEIQSGQTSLVSVQTGVIQMAFGRFSQMPGKIQLIFTRAPELTAEQFQRDRCREVAPNIALMADFPPLTSPKSLYLPPGLYRVLTQYDRRLMGGDKFIKVMKGRDVTATLDDAGLHANPPVKPPVYHGKCYY